MQAHSPDEIALCDIVKFELYYGAYNSRRRTENLETLQYFFSEFRSLPFDGNAAQICGYWRRALIQNGLPIGAYDLHIAAIALANDIILITHNVREFQRIDRLKIEDWET